MKLSVALSSVRIGLVFKLLTSSDKDIPFPQNTVVYVNYFNGISIYVYDTEK